MFIISMIQSIMMVLIVYMIFVMIFYKSFLDMESMSSYECGFDPNCYTRLVFSYRFFLISILFIIFDVEICLMLPVPFLMESDMGLWIIMLFLMILVLGLLYEYNYGSLDWLEVS